MKYALILFALLTARLLAAEPSLVPDTPNTAPDYFCTWNLQGFVSNYSDPNAQADAMIEANLFGKGPNQNWVEMYPDARRDLIFVLDDTWDIPLGGGRSHPMRGSLELDSQRFPSYQGTPAERLARLNRDVRAHGWRSVGLWVCSARAKARRDMTVSDESYWSERLRWAQEAGIDYWKVDWGAMGSRDIWRLNQWAHRVAPRLWIEHGGFDPNGARMWLPDKIDVFRTYDVNPSAAIPVTIRRVANILRYPREEKTSAGLINCEDEPYLGAGLGCVYGVMRHPLVGNLPNGKPDKWFKPEYRDLKRRLDEVTRAVRWHRIAHPFGVGDHEAIDASLLKEGSKDAGAPSRIARGGLPLPTVTMPAGQEPPYVLCSRHPDGEIAVATLGRRTPAGVVIPPADITLEVGELNRPVGVFGEYSSLTLVTNSPLAGKRILAQDLAGLTPVDITGDVKVSDGRLTIPGAVIHRVGLTAARPGDLSDPGLVLAIPGLTKALAKPAMTPVNPTAACRIDPARAQVEDAPKLPRVLLRGDSVSVGNTRGGGSRTAAPSPPIPLPQGESGAMLQSPDGTIRLTVVLVSGVPHWQVTSDGKSLIGQGLLGVELSQDRLIPPLILVGTERDTRNATWRAVWGNLSEVPDRYSELTVKLREAAGARRLLEVVVRAYNEGVACRYRFPMQPNLEHVAIKKRLTEYRFGADRTVYQNRKYEYGTVTVDTMSKSEGNVTVDAGGGRFVSLTDADCADFSRVAWERKKDASGTIVGSLNSPAEGATPFQTSWEVLIVGRTAANLYESRHLVENLNPPCAIGDTSWIRPGKAISQIRNTRMVTAELKKLMDFASAHRIEYVEVDHSWCGAETKWTPAEIEFFAKNKSKFWDDKPEWRHNVGGNPMASAKGWVPFRPKADSGGNFVDLDVAEVAAYGDRLSPKVGLCLYVRGAVLKEFGGEHPADDVFAAYQRWGLAGVKLGFVPSASQHNERAVADVVRKAAAHRLIVNIHDGYYPSGLSRTYPNLMNVEGVAGEEAEPSIDPKIKSLHDVMLPFTRCLMGPVDYTPEMFKASKTHAHQVAMLGIYHGRSTIRGGVKQWSPGGVGGGEIEFVEKLPCLFDEMKVIADLGKYVTVARRCGDAWFVASMSDSHPRAYDLPLTFLRPGLAYRASVYADTPGNLQTSHSHIAVSSTSVVPIAMEPDGGHLMIVEPAGTISGR